MKYAVVYSSRTGNTKLLAETLKEALKEDECIYFGPPDAAALKAERIYAGFWTDRGSCCSETAEFLKTIRSGEVYLFGTAGFGGDGKYFEKLLKRSSKLISKDVHIAGGFMCQGRMPMKVRERYEKMLKKPIRVPGIKKMVENFDRALSHPNEADLNALKAAVISSRP